MNYFELTINLEPVEPWRDILISQLAEVGFESFVETKSGLQAYVSEILLQEGDYDEFLTIDAVQNFELKTIEDKNWNAEWEKNFDPVFVENKLAIIAPFHTGDFEQEMTITIQPQMSFGTGHHQTTWLASKKMFELELLDKRVLDMGTGTGILAILAEKLGAASVFAPDIDVWSYNNALENTALNKCMNVEVALGGIELIQNRTFDVIIANINKNILITQFPAYAEALEIGGTLLISGFFVTDKPDLVIEAEKNGFIFQELYKKDEWALLQFVKK